jgi:hypothetical protein
VSREVASLPGWLVFALRALGIRLTAPAGLACPGGGLRRGRLERVSPFTNAGFARMHERAGTWSSCRLVSTRTWLGMLAVSRWRTEATTQERCRPIPGTACPAFGALYRTVADPFQEFLLRMTAPDFRTPHPKLRRSADDVVGEAVRVAELQSSLRFTSKQPPKPPPMRG